MTTDIHATNQQFSTAVSIFYATYVTFETSAAVVMKKLTPRLMLTVICCAWSLTTIFTGFIHNVGGLYATRLVLGACEAGLFPCLNLYLTMVYRREEQAKRVAYLFSCSALSGAFGGLLAYVLLKMDGVSGIDGWLVFSVCKVTIFFFGSPGCGVCLKSTQTDRICPSVLTPETTPQPRSSHQRKRLFNMLIWW